MPNTLLSPTTILKDTEARFENSCVMSKYVDRSFDGKFAIKDEKVGATVNARMPVRYKGSTGETYAAEDTTEIMKAVTINTRWKVCPEFSDVDLLLTIDRFGERYLAPAGERLANMIDTSLTGLYTQVDNISPNAVPGTIPTTRLAYTLARAALAKYGVPDLKQRSLVVNPDAEAYMVEFGATMFNDQKDLARQYAEGTMGIYSGMKVSVDQNIASQQLGAWGTTSNPIVSALPAQNAQSVATSGWAAGATLNAGDVVSFGGSNAVNPLTWLSLGMRQNFAVSALCTADGAGLMTITLNKKLNDDATSVSQNLTARPAINSTVKVYGQGTGAALNAISGLVSPQHLLFHMKAFVLAIVKQELPGGMEWSEQVTNQRSGFAMRLVRGYDIVNNKKMTRLEVLGGVQTLREDFAMRIPG